MKSAIIFLAALAWMPLTIGGPDGQRYGSDIDALAKRVSNLERQVADLQKASERIEKTVAALPQNVGARNEGVERQVGELTKTVAGLDRASSQIQKTIAATEKHLEAIAVRCDARTLQLAKWFDGYNPRKHDDQYHQREVARQK